MNKYRLEHVDCFDWLTQQPPDTVHAVCTDPPYGLIEFSTKELNKLRNGNRGGVWRILPRIGGSRRDPLPRFTVISEQQKGNLSAYQLYPSFVGDVLDHTPDMNHKLPTAARELETPLFSD